MRGREHVPRILKNPTHSRSVKQCQILIQALLRERRPWWCNG